MDPVHIICIFDLVCRIGAPCETNAPTLINLRYQLDAQFAEVWFGEEPQLPWPALLQRPGDLALFNHLSFFVSGDLAYAQLITLDPDTLAASWTVHVPSSEGLSSGHLTPHSAQTTCAVAEDGI